MQYDLYEDSTGGPTLARIVFEEYDESKRGTFRVHLTGEPVKRRPYLYIEQQGTDCNIYADGALVWRTGFDTCQHMLARAAAHLLAYYPQAPVEVVSWRAEPVRDYTYDEVRSYLMSYGFSVSKPPRKEGE